MNGLLRAATDGDRDLILAWRNHPEVRQVSITRHVIGAEEHRTWWRAVMADDRWRVLIYERSGVPCGVVTFGVNQDDRSAVWGFYLDIAGLRERGELLPAWMDLERSAIAYAFDELALDRIGGETLAFNTQVLALHRRFGFRETARYVRPVEGAAQVVVWTELRAADAGARAVATARSGTDG